LFFFFLPFRLRAAAFFVSRVRISCFFPSPFDLGWCSSSFPPFPVVTPEVLFGFFSVQSLATPGIYQAWHFFFFFLRRWIFFLPPSLFPTRLPFFSFFLEPCDCFWKNPLVFFFLAREGHFSCIRAVCSSFSSPEIATVGFPPFGFFRPVPFFLSPFCQGAGHSSLFFLPGSRLFFLFTKALGSLSLDPRPFPKNESPPSPFWGTLSRPFFLHSHRYLHMAQFFFFFPGRNPPIAIFPPSSREDLPFFFFSLGRRFSPSLVLSVFPFPFCVD